MLYQESYTVDNRSLIPLWKTLQSSLEYIPQSHLTPAVRYLYISSYLYWLRTACVRPIGIQQPEEFLRQVKAIWLEGLSWAPSMVKAETHLLVMEGYCLFLPRAWPYGPHWGRQKVDGGEEANAGEWHSDFRRCRTPEQQELYWTR
jgi:hypothetical protein